MAGGSGGTPNTVAPTANTSVVQQANAGQNHVGGTAPGGKGGGGNPVGAPQNPSQISFGGYGQQSPFGMTNPSMWGGTQPGPQGPVQNAFNPTQFANSAQSLGAPPAAAASTGGSGSSSSRENGAAGILQDLRASQASSADKSAPGYNQAGGSTTASYRPSIVNTAGNYVGDKVNTVSNIVGAGNVMDTTKFKDDFQDSRTGYDLSKGRATYDTAKVKAQAKAKGPTPSRDSVAKKASGTKAASKSSGGK